ncbi:MAG: nitronate monooxygenase, partial [Anaerolineae bacterium]|nr:nitronate monooxygenase [Anaerolineae bacterium]
AGGYGNPEKFQEALALGAAGVQLGTAFAYCNESGMDKNLKSQIIQKVMDATVDVMTSPVASPTGFPFKVVPVEGTLTEGSVYEARERVCDLGFLRHLYKNDDGKVAYRCPSEPVDHYVQKGGKEEDTVGRTCMCNNLGATAGFANQRRNGYIEPALVTSGDDLLNLKQFFKEGQTNYSARDVIEYIMQQEPALP